MGEPTTAGVVAATRRPRKTKQAERFQEKPPGAADLIQQFLAALAKHPDAKIAFVRGHMPNGAEAMPHMSQSEQEVLELRILYRLR